MTEIGIEVPEPVAALLARSRALGADRSVTNYGGGNTSCKTTGRDPVTGEEVELLWVKGSGGDLATLDVAGLAVLDLARLRGLARRWRGPEHDDAVARLVPRCALRPSGPSPSIDTAMHALLPAAHVDHLHPDAVIALATAVDGERLTKECFGSEVGWVDWQRPGFALGVQIAAMCQDAPSLRGVVLGGHGLTSWADDSETCRAVSLDIIARATRFLAERGRPAPFGPLVPANRPLPDGERRRLAAALAPHIRGLCSTDRRAVLRFRDDPVILDFLAREAAPRLAPKGTSCPDHFIRTKVRPLLLDLPPGTPVAALAARLRELHTQYRADYAAYYRRHATASSPPMREADPAIVLVPGVGMFSAGPDARAARIAGEFYVNAINVMRGAEAVSRYEPIPEEEKFRIEYWELEAAKLGRLPPPLPLTGRVAFVTGGASGIGRSIARRLAGEGAAVVIADRDMAGATEVAAGLGGPDRATAVEVDVRDEAAVRAATAAAAVSYGGVDIIVNNAGLSVSKPLLDTTVEDWCRQHDVMARGSFLVSREALRVLLAQGLPADIVYVVSKNGVVAGPDNLAYGAAKADQAHQVRLLAAELAAHGVRVNGVNPDGVVHGSGIFAGSWGARRARAHGVARQDLGRFYAERTLLKREVLPEHVAAAVFVLVSDELSRTTGVIIPVDSGIPAAFLR